MGPSGREIWFEDALKAIGGIVAEAQELFDADEFEEAQEKLVQLSFAVRLGLRPPEGVDAD